MRQRSALFLECKSCTCLLGNMSASSITPSNTPAHSAPQLHAQALHVGHGDWTLCRGWSHAWPPGLHLLQGGDGAGKSSLLRVLAGAQRPLDGVVRWAHGPLAARDVFWVDPRQPEQQGATQGTPAQWMALQAQAYPRWRAQQWQHHAQQWGLQVELEKPWHALSTGTARKLWMAAALASGASLVLMDEPTAGLDRPSIAYLRQALAACAESTASVSPFAQWVLVAHFDDLQGLPWSSVLELEALPK